MKLMGFIGVSIKKDTLFHCVQLVRKLYVDKSVIKETISEMEHTFYGCPFAEFSSSYLLFSVKIWALTKREKIN